MTTSQTHTHFIEYLVRQFDAGPYALNMIHLEFPNGVGLGLLVAYNDQHVRADQAVLHALQLTTIWMMDQGLPRLHHAASCTAPIPGDPSATWRHLWHGADVINWQVIGFMRPPVRLPNKALDRDVLVMIEQFNAYMTTAVLGREQA